MSRKQKRKHWPVVCVFQNDLFRNTLFPQLKSVAFHDLTSGPSAHFSPLTSRRTNIENKMTLSLGKGKK